MEISKTMARNILALLNRVPLGTTPGTTMQEAAVLAQIHQTLEAGIREPDKAPEPKQEKEPEPTVESEKVK